MSSVISVVLFLWVCCLGAGASQPGCFRDSTRGVTCTLVIQRLIKAPDGFARAVLAINGHVPGPSIEAIQGDNLRITVINLSDEHTMLHWHGIHQIGTPFMDGTDLVQCPIAPGGNMTYEFVADPPGTHWYHSHHGSQLIDGLFGPLIVQSRMDPYLNQYDEERVLIFGEWAQQTADRQTAAWKAFEYAFYANTSPARVSGDDIGGWWVNGFRYNWTYASDGSLVGVIPFTGGIINGVGHSVASNSSLQTHYFVNVTSNVKYRFRLISFAPFYAFAVSFEGHAVDLIGSDGAILKRSGPYDTVYVHGGERYDVIVSATKTSGSYWIRLQTLENNKTQNRILGVLSYNGENILPSTNPESVPYGRRANCFTGEPTDQCIPFTEEKPFFATPLPPPDYTFTANLRFFYGPVINTLHYQPPPRPLLYDPNFVQSSDFSRCNPDEKCSRGCNCTSFETLRSSDLVQVVINNPWRQYNVSLSGAHPIHLHGHAFYVTGMGLNGSFNPDLHTLNRVDPPQKDTIIVPPGGWVVIEFFADNPGMWLMHCHMDHHLVDGMAMFFYENPLARWQMPSSLPSCNIHMQNQNGPVSSPNKGSKTSLTSGFILLFAGLFF